MRLNIRSVGSLGLLLTLGSMAMASGLAMGGSDNQTWILSTGPDITSFTETENYYLPAWVTGTGSTGASNTMNNPSGSFPTGGGTYYNTNSSALVSAGGTAYEESGMGQFYFFTNNGSVAENVTLGWQGFVTASATASGTAEAWDYASSFIEDAETNSYAETVSVEAASPGIGNPASQFGQGTYTFTVAAGQKEYEIYSLAYNEAEVTPEPAPLLALGLGALGLFLRRKRRA